MLKKCNESDFYEIDMIGYGRLHPRRLSVFFWATFAFSGFITMVMFFALISNPFLNQNWYLILGVNLLLQLFHFIFSLLYTSKKITYKFQRFQSLLLLLFGFRLSVDMYQIYFLICDDKDAPSTVINAAIILLLGGFVYLFYSTIRAIVRVRKGAFRQGGKLLYDFQTSKTHISIPIIFGAVMMTSVIARTLNNVSQMGDVYFMLFLCVGLQYSIAFALPEFFLYAYCKFRFPSFRIKPVEKSTGRRRKI